MSCGTSTEATTSSSGGVGTGGAASAHVTMTRSVSSPRLTPSSIGPYWLTRYSVTRAPSVRRLKCALRATSGSKVHVMCPTSRANAHARWCCLSTRPSPWLWYSGSTPVMCECIERAAGAAKKATDAPTMPIAVVQADGVVAGVRERAQQVRRHAGRCRRPRPRPAPRRRRRPPRRSASERISMPGGVTGAAGSVMRPRYAGPQCATGSADAGIRSRRLGPPIAWSDGIEG